MEPELDETDSNETVLHFSKLDIMDDNCLEKIKMIVEAGEIEKLKVDHCKIYLRKNGLRLSGNKDTLVKRIKEHLEILNAGGEKKYPVSSFVLNCTGDACTGDVVMFEQNVYEMFNIASRSATGPPCGTRTIVGRIVKEGYGAAKQQHTFTVEVLWSKGTKPLPLLYPLLIKGRNLYKMKTLRQRWENEGDRQRVLLEKHSRGSLARSARETRVLEKEKRKMLKKNRVSRKEGSNGSSTTQAQQTRASQNIGDNIKKNGREHFQKVPSQRNIIDFPAQSSRPLKGMNLQSTGQPILQGHMQQQYCRYQERCYYGENCKFKHDIREKNVAVTEKRGPDVFRSQVMREYH